jgi:GntR family transcriptional regulator, rspAB operon transcriptional repressor
VNHRPRSIPLNSQVYEQIKALITSCQLAQGHPLVEEELAGMLGVSRTPIRDALRRLSQEGFVETIPRKGSFAANLSIVDISEILVIREGLEGIAARIAASTLSTSTLVTLQRKYDHLEQLRVIGQLREAGDELHNEILLATGNRRMFKALKLYEEHMSWFHNIAVRMPGRVEKSFLEHQIILDALVARDGEQSERAMHQHLQSVRRDLETWTVPRI